MANYCRYCASAIEGDCFYCTEKERVMSEQHVKQPNYCKEYVDCGIDLITGKRHLIKPKKAKSGKYKQKGLDI
jgi:hypothetical protein